jgi:hypothetical protein
MILLPRGNPVKENIDPSRINLPDAFSKLSGSGFSGYLRFEGRGGEAIVIYARGKMISALFEGFGDRLTARGALAPIFTHSLAGGVRLDIYRLSSELALSIHALLHGKVLFQGQELKLIDIKSLLRRLKTDRLNGCLRIYTDDHIALIFYRDGEPLGFFHDGSTEIETAADTSMSVARLPGAKIDILAMKSSEEETLEDLADLNDLPVLWGQSKELVIRQRRMAESEASDSREQRAKEKGQKVLSFLRGTAERHIGRIGVSLVEKEFDRAAGQGAVAGEDLAAFYEQLTRGAKLVAGPSKVAAMIEDMKRGIKALLLS